MRKLVVFNQVTLDGYFTDRNGDMSWAHKNDAEWNAFAADNAKGGGVLLFGRITYELMASFWPTQQAMKSFPTVAEGMNNLAKVVFSRRWEDDVRRRQREAEIEADNDADLRQWECLAVLRADGVKG